MTPRRAKLVKRIVQLLAVCFVLAILVGLWAWWRSSQRPVWFEPTVNPTAEEAARGEYLENQLVTQFHKVRPEESARWTIDLDEEWMNAWLAARFPQWAASQNLQIADELSAVHVSITENEFRIGVSMAQALGGRIVSLASTPSIDENGQLVLTDSNLRLGRLNLPTDWLQSVGGLSQVNFAPAQAILVGQPLEPVVRLADGRQVRILAMELHPGRISLSLETIR